MLHPFIIMADVVLLDRTRVAALTDGAALLCPILELLDELLPLKHTPRFLNWEDKIVSNM